MIRTILLAGLLSGTFLSASSRDSLSGEDQLSYGGIQDFQDRQINFSADRVTYDKALDLVIASGGVTLYHENTAMEADMVSFDRAAGTVTATGNVMIRDDRGNILFLEEATLKDGLKEGFIANVRMLFSDDARLVAEEGDRVQGKTTLRNAAYSPCKVCNEDGKRKPLWHIRADRITHDEEDRVIKYKNVVLEIAGIPVFYTPYFSHPDPTVHSKSGFLAPEFATSSELGLNVTVPYYFALAPHRDFTFEPLFTTKEGVVPAGTYRQHTGNGEFFINGSITNAEDRTIEGDSDDYEIRGHIFSEGKFDLDKLKFAGDKWQWDYALRWVNNDTYLRRFYQDRSDVLESHVRIENFSGRNYFTAGLYGFQGLDEEDIASKTGHALPSFDLNMVTDPGKWGNQLSLDASGVAIVRTDGINTQRMSMNAAWKLPLRTRLGDSYTFTASVRGDVYHQSSAHLQDQPIYGGEDGTFARLLPQLAVDWKLPFIKTGGTTQHIIEPLISVIVAPEERNSTNIANEDSRNFEFDENNLFSHNRYNGYDRWESGTRVNYGLRYSLFAGDITAITVLGQSFRLDPAETFPAGSGYEGKSSDFVGRLDLILGDYVDYVHRFRLDKNTLGLRRNELILSGGPKNIKAHIRYLDLDRETTDLSDTELENRKELGAGLKYDVSENWTLHGSWVHDLLKNDTISYDAGVIFKNDCLEFGVRYEKRLTTDRDITPSSTFHFKLILKNLG